MLKSVFAALIAVMPVSATAESRLSDFSFKGILFGDMPLSEYEGRVVLLVNTASMCAFTPQYDTLQEVYERYEPQGLTVIGVPSDDFGGQEYDTSEDVKEFCEANFNITFPMTDITHVKGDEVHPFFAWMAEEGHAPRWNFTKYLFDRDGEFIESFPSTVTPDSKRLIRALEAALAEKPSG